MLISCCFHLLPSFLLFPTVYLALRPDLAKDEAVVVEMAGMEVAEGEEVEIETGTAEAVGKAAARLSQGLWQGPVHAQVQVTASGRR